MDQRPGEFLYLDQAAALRAGVLDMPAAIERVQRALSLLDAGACIEPPKSVLRWSDDPGMEATRGRVNFLSAYIGGEMDVLGMKWIGSFPTNRERGLPRATALIVLNDPATGIPIALLDGGLVSAMRTGAVTGIAARLLARPDARSVGIIGTGVHSRTQLLGLCAALPGIEEVRVWNRTRDRGDRFIEEMRPRTGRTITMVDSPERAVRGVDVAVVATTSHEQLMRGAWLRPGVLSIQFSGDECDAAVIHDADKIVCDDWETVKHRGITTPAVMHRAGLLADSDIHANLGEIINGRKPGREDPDERIHLAAIGLGVSDVALASQVYDTAVRLGIGTRLALWESPLWT